MCLSPIIPMTQDARMLDRLREDDLGYAPRIP
jgi:hypothetical protein